MDVLRPERLVEPEGLPYLLDVLRAGVFARDLYRRIGRDQVDEREDERQDPEGDRNHLKEPPDDVLGQGAPDPPCLPVMFQPRILVVGAMVPPNMLNQEAMRRRSRVRDSMFENASTIDWVQRRFGSRATTSPSRMRNVPSRVVPVIRAVFGSSRPLT